MPYTITRAHVGNFPKWRRAFDENAEAREEAGSGGGHIFRNSSDREEVVVFLAWEDEERAREYFASESAAGEWDAAEVSEGPETTYLEELSRPRR